MNPLAFIIVAVIAAVYLYYLLWFCRRPRRFVPKGEHLVSPANGRVALVQRYAADAVNIKKWNRGGVKLLCHDVAPRGWLILIVMTPWHVHYQRAPAAARLLSSEYRPGTFRNAVRDADTLKTLENERCEMLFETTAGPGGKYKVVQIAGLLARRIQRFVREGQGVEKGDLIGFINFGSQVALVMPDSWKPSVKVGDSVVDGESILGVPA